MKPTAFAGTNARIRVYESNLLRNDQFERMLQAPDFEEALNVLKDTPYRNDIEQLKETKDYDLMLVNELQRMYAELFSISPEPNLVELFSLRYSYHNLKVLLKEYFTKNDFTTMLIPIGKNSISTLRQAVETSRSDDLDQEYLTSILEVKTDYEDYSNIQSIDIILDRRYFTHLKQLAIKIEDPKVLELIVLYIDLNNLSTLTRAISQKRSRNFLTTILSDAGSMPIEELISLGSESLEEAGKKLAEGKYREIVTASIRSDNQELSPVKIDLATDDAFMEKMKDAKLEVFGPMPLLAYIYAKENEVKNLRLVLVGKENKLPLEEVTERMRINYGS
ncbi:MULTISPECIES: V-type ATP synthase subunit C [Carnobacterium]|uniref:V-type ATP synthase subunit C n=1 Tax=Carnobacterium antarcticum TaxID=2126436 RepID=A0ABW4NP06_9LACT|nr:MULTISPECIES: V-type ATP synthase subunit C [unclassified Carnobacterium]ALV20930.1 V-type ATP synthase subunit C [Carnobacterium sp. CP1]QQP71081.1 V-type ATP synthase subunit C [Carnobacterium sp. CS13]